MIEDRLNGQDPPPKTIEESALVGNLYEHIKPLIDIIHPHFTETALYSDMLEVAGTVDCFATTGILTEDEVIDFKNSIRPKKTDWINNYRMQVAVYSLMIKETFNLGTFPPGKIIISVFNGIPAAQQFYVSPYEIEYIWIPQFREKLSQFRADMKGKINHVP
jgi:hypothetical protein